MSATYRWHMPLSGPSFWGDGKYPPSDAVYYPLYTKCAELGTAAVHQHRDPRTADPRRGAEPDPPRPGVRAVPRTEAVHDPRRRPMVGRRDPAADQVPEPAADDVGLVAEATARQPVALHAHPRARQGHLRLGLAGAATCAAWCPRRWRWTCRPTCSTTTSTTTRRSSSSAARAGELTMDRYELRRLDYSLSEDHEAVQEAYQHSSRPTARSRPCGRPRRPGSTRACGNGCARWARRPWRCPSPWAATVRRWST